MNNLNRYFAGICLLLFVAYSGNGLAARVSLSSLQAQIEVLEEELDTLRQQLADLQLGAGPPGADGLSCWDSNGNGIRDDEEDINRDGRWDAGDCTGGSGDLEPIYDLINALAEQLDALEMRLENLDADNDGYSPKQGDCNDSDAAVSPVAAEILGDGIDNDCDGNVDQLADNDGDGFTVEDGDCDNFDPTVYPGAPELRDGKDNDCDNTLDDEDRDGDGFSVLDGDCNDFDHQRYPGAPELPNNIDNNCNGTTSDEDHDFDGFTRAVDCDDRDSRVKPNQTGYYSTRSSGNSTFDYNCDGSVEYRYTEKGSCSNNRCGNGFTGYYDCFFISETGWYGSTPSCGNTGDWVDTDDNTSLSGTCSGASSNRRQVCR